MRNRSYLARTTARWALLTLSFAGLLFFTAGTTEIASLRAYITAFSGLLLVTMLAVHPDLAEERVHAHEGSLDSGARLATGFLFLVTLMAAAVDVGRLHESDAVPAGVRLAALAVFSAAIAVQASAMIVNPFFSPVIRLQKERNHRIVTCGPYRLLRHPGYLGMLIAIPASALALGSWLALIPGLAFSGVIIRRTACEDRFLKVNLPGYAGYTGKVRYRLLPGIW
jgi:protein-S-isoprenylcysteine O-methyltransferase Ste14